MLTDSFSGSIIPSLYYLLVMVVLASFITIKFAKTQRKIIKATLILNIISFAILIYPSVNITYHELARKKEIKSSELSFSQPLQTLNPIRPDIYYIVPDSYASNSTLKNYFDFDNSEFTDYLKSKGFYVAENSKANYPFTTPSLTSSLNMGYLDVVAEQMGVNSQDQTPLFRLTEDNQVVLYLKSLGYKYYHFGPRQLPTSLNKNADFNYTYANNQLAFSPLAGLLLEQTLFSYMVSSVDCAYVNSVLCIGSLNNRRSHYNYILDQIVKVEDTAGMDGPKFIFYHNLLTHVPYVFTVNGKYVSRAVEASRDWKENYINQLKFTNKILKQLIETILRDSKNPPIIVLQSDEGPYPERFRSGRDNFEWKEATKDELKEKFGILNAYYLPGVETKDLNAGISPVNTFRIILDKYFGGQLPLLEDMSFAQTRYANSYDIFNVTNSLR
ncbi:sulfatase-like hydrolase/transferase [Candidatus Daviesbacteria bacterium]|nr:sulfatase-like hydrolase/transferase [Candidatus Daviesbacteria bacterium]